jgi:hypothetical protein
MFRELATIKSEEAAQQEPAHIDDSETMVKLGWDKGCGCCCSVDTVVVGSVEWRGNKAGNK